MSAFRDNEKPPEPPPPPRFSPLRPARAFGRWAGGFLWLFLTTTEVWEDVTDSHGRPAHDPTAFGCAGFLVALVSVVTAVMSFVLGGFPWWVYLWGGLVLLRLWLRAAMHLDEEESREWWKEKLT